MKAITLIGAACFALSFSAVQNAIASLVTFQVNLAYQITNDSPTFDTSLDTVEVRGSFYDSWNSGLALVRVGSTTIYTNTFDITTTSPGDLIEFKYHTYGMDDNWENLQGYIYTNDGNRAFVFSGSPQAVTPVYFNDVWGGTIPLTLQVDMGPQVIVGNFDPSVDTVEARGSWDGFSNGVTLTNDPTSANTNLYSMTFDVTYPAPGGLGAYKFHYYGSQDVYEPRDNRFLIISNVPTKMPVVFFNDLNTNDLLFVDTLVTFTVNMTNAMDINGYVFNPGNPNYDTVYLNGDFFGWWPWGYFPSSQYQLYPVGTSEVYTNTFLIPKGNPVALTYKYAINEYGYYAPDTEAPFKVNHLRYVRHTGSTVLPMDMFGIQLIEPLVGALNINRQANKQVKVTWNGHVGIHLQTSTNLMSGWRDLPETEAMTSTNYPGTNGTTFFRLIKP